MAARTYFNSNSLQDFFHICNTNITKIHSTTELAETYFVMHISINVRSVGYFSQATFPNVVGLCADRISNITQPFQYKLAIANSGGQYLQK
jgi:hypothetical protein